MSTGSAGASRAPARKVVFVLGGADCLGPDYASAVELCGVPAEVFATNHSARDWPAPVDHLVTMHPILVPRWISDRRAKGGSDPRAYWCPRAAFAQTAISEGFEFRFAESWGMTSGGLCIAAARQCGYRHIVLCGVPLVAGNRHYDNRNPWTDARQFHRAWERKMEAIRPYVRSMSGWTMERLGLPTAEWLRG